MDYVSTDSGIVVPEGTIETQGKTDKELVARTFQAMAQLEQHFPQLVLLAKRLVITLDHFAHRKGVSIHGVLTDMPRWHPSGMVVVPIGLDPAAVRDPHNDRAAKNYANLRLINDDCPQAVDVAMSIGFQLVPLLNQRKLMPQTVTVGKPVWAADEKAIHIKLNVPPPMDTSL